MMSMTADLSEKNLSALIVGRPGPLQASLAALLTTIPSMGMVTLSDDRAFSLENVRTWNPDIVLLEAFISGCTPSQVLEQIRQEQPHIRWVVLADSVQQLQEAQTVGADAALLKGDSPTELVQAIERLLALN